MLNPLTIIGFSLILFIAFLAVFPNWLTPYSIYDLNVRPMGVDFAPPSVEHPLGTTKLGWDVLGRLIWGARTSLTAGLVAITVSVSFGTFIGVISAYLGGIVDSIIMRIFDLIIAFPNLVLLLVIVQLIEPTLFNILLVFGILGIPGYARLVRATVLQVKENLYVEAAITSGADKFRTMFSHILPNALSPIIISVFGALGATILGISGLAFLGISDAEMIDWGSDINVARTRFFSNPSISLWPGLFIGVTVLGFMLIGDGMRDALDPRLKK